MNEKNENNVNQPAETKKKPDESGGVQVDEFVKIYDPDSGKVFVAKRGES